MRTISSPALEIQIKQQVMDELHAAARRRGRFGVDREG
jgi:hypothetical protein